jgi:hypothetical protein
VPPCSALIDPADTTLPGAIIDTRPGVICLSGTRLNGALPGARLPQSPSNELRVAAAFLLLILKKELGKKRLL